MSKKPQNITDESELTYLKVFAKEITNDNKKFTRYFAYLCNSKWENEYKSIVDKETKENKIIPVSIGIHFNEETMAKLKLDKVEFPVHMTLTDDQYFITYDKDKEKKYKTRNDGTKIEVCVILGYTTIDHFETPKKTFADLKGSSIDISEE